MPRHTHPRDVQKHPRAHKFFHDERVAKKRFRRAKRTYSSAHYTTQNSIGERQGKWIHYKERVAPYFIHPDEIAKNPLAHNHSWPFSFHSSQWKRNPMNHCSCEGCSGPRFDKSQRLREKRLWKAESEEEARPLL